MHRNILTRDNGIENFIKGKIRHLFVRWKDEKKYEDHYMLNAPINDIIEEVYEYIEVTDHMQYCIMRVWYSYDPSQKDIVKETVESYRERLKLICELKDRIKRYNQAIDELHYQVDRLYKYDHKTWFGEIRTLPREI